MNQGRPIIYSKKEAVPAGLPVIEVYENSLEELFFLVHPQFKKTTPEIEKKKKNFLKSHKIGEVWIYYPWKELVVHAPEEKVYFQLRTARNQNIITTSEQRNYRKLKVGVAGLSVGSYVLSSLVLSGGPQTIKIADFDVIEITNLNRIRAGLPDVGKNKTRIAAREVWELDPFADLYLWEEGLNKDKLQDFIASDPTLEVFIDEIDDINLKINSRLICKKQKIPVLMATDNGDSIILDVERFDEEPARPIFHGLMGDLQKSVGDNKYDYQKWLELANKIVGPEFLTRRMKESLHAVGQTLPAIPQLGTTAAMAGAAISFVVRRIANKQAIPSGRYIVSLEEKLVQSKNQT